MRLRLAMLAALLAVEAHAVNVTNVLFYNQNGPQCTLAVDQWSTPTVRFYLYSDAGSAYTGNAGTNYTWTLHWTPERQPASIAATYQLAGAYYTNGYVDFAATSNYFFRSCTRGWGAVTRYIDLNDRDQWGVFDVNIDPAPSLSSSAAIAALGIMDWATISNVNVTASKFVLTNDTRSIDLGGAGYLRVPVTPVETNDAASKQYVDMNILAGGVSVSVLAATSALDRIYTDGVGLAVSNALNTKVSGCLTNAGTYTGGAAFTATKSGRVLDFTWGTNLSLFADDVGYSTDAERNAASNGVLSVVGAAGYLTSESDTLQSVVTRGGTVTYNGSTGIHVRASSSAVVGYATNNWGGVFESGGNYGLVGSTLGDYGVYGYAAGNYGMYGYAFGDIGAYFSGFYTGLVAVARDDETNGVAVDARGRVLATGGFTSTSVAGTNDFSLSALTIVPTTPTNVANAAATYACVTGAVASATYLPLTGGTVAGNLTLDEGVGDSPSIVFIDVNDNQSSLYGDSFGNFTFMTIGKYSVTADYSLFFDGINCIDLTDPGNGNIICGTNTATQFIGNGSGLTNLNTSESDTLQSVVTRGGTVTSGAVTIDAANARTNTFGGSKTILGWNVESGNETTASGTESRAGGYQSVASGDFAIADGFWCQATAEASYSIGSGSYATNYSAFVWNSYYDGFGYGSHGICTFNINPTNGFYGVYIGTQNLGALGPLAINNGGSLTNLNASALASGTVPNARLDTDLQTLATPGNWKVFYTDGSGNVQVLALGASGTYLKANGTTSAPTFETPAGGGGGSSYPRFLYGANAVDLYSATLLTEVYTNALLVNFPYVATDTSTLEWFGDNAGFVVPSTTTNIVITVVGYGASAQASVNRFRYSKNRATSWTIVTNSLTSTTSTADYTFTNTVAWAQGDIITWQTGTTTASGDFRHEAILLELR